jgi:hypothetical protein
MATKQTYVVWAPNDTTPEVLKRRAALFDDHMKNITLPSEGDTLSVSFVSFGDTKYLLNNRAGRTSIRSCNG